MSNSSLVNYTKLSPNCTKPRNHTIDTITIHCMAGNLSVEACGVGFARASRRASSNYGIGTDGRIALYVEEKNRSWCSGNRANDNRAITIEVANTAANDPWPVSDEAYASLINLLVDVCRRNGIQQLLWKGDRSLAGQVSKQNMTVHRWFQAKACPGDYLYHLHPKIAAEVNARLAGTIVKVNHEEDDMNKEKFKELFLEMRQNLRDNDASNYSQEARDWAVNSGLIKGGSDTEFNGMWEDLMTREQLVTVLYRFAQLVGKA